jgi:bifunctional non-homologous end joining protein LigD
VLGKGPVFFQAVCAQGLEGVVSKRADCPWRSGRGKTWRKVRCGQRQELVVVGWTDPAGARSAFGALLLGYWEGDTLRYAGRVGTGFDEATLASLKARLDPLARADCPLAAVPEDARRAHWVEPRLVAEVSFTEWTPDNRLRHPVFHGLREDKPATEVVREAPVPIPAEPRPGAPVRVAGVALTHPERVYWPDVGVTKLDLARYLERVADRMLPHVAGRPLTLVRCTEGLGRPCFHQRHHGAGLPEGVGRVVVPGHGGGEAYVWIADRAGLVGLAQVGVLEIHPWGVRVERPDHPDRLVFDLDPGPGLAWPQLVEAAEYVRNRLTTIGLQGFVRLTGSKGLHVVVPLVPSAPWAAVQPFCRAVAEGIARAWPERFTARMAPERRPGKIYLDYLRNTPTSTAVASWSPRALPGAPIALPVTWEALAAMGGSDRAGLRQIAAEPPPDPWPDLDAIDQRVDVETLRRAGLG